MLLTEEEDDDKVKIIKSCVCVCVCVYIHCVAVPCGERVKTLNQPRTHKCVH